MIGLLAVLTLVGVAAIVGTVVLVVRDGHGYRPGPRSHEIETRGSSWPHHDVGPR